MPTIAVANTYELNLALGAVQGGDTVLLGAGTYDAISIRNFDAGGTVNITSADPGHQAVITNMQIKDSAGLSFTNLTVSVTANSTAAGAVGIFTSSNIQFDHMNVHGTLDGNPQNDTAGFRFSKDTNVSVTNSEIQQVNIAVGFGDTTTANFSGNNIHDISLDGIRGGGSSKVTIAYNYITNIYQAAGAHADGIQFYDGSNTNLVTHDITITGNVLSQGVGNEFQGIFMSNEVEGGLFQNVTISNNLILGGNFNGIAVFGADGLNLVNNTVVSRVGETSWIRIDNATLATVSGNAATRYLLDPDSQIVVANNTVNITSGDDGALALHDWLSHNAGLKALLPGAVAAADALLKPADIAAAGADSVVTANSFTLASTAHNLTLTGTANVDGAGNALGNHIIGNDGANRLMGFDGDDILEGGGGADTLDGGAGIDTASYEHSSVGVKVSLTRYTGERHDGVAQETVGAGKDMLNSIENLTGSAFNDTLTGYSDNNVLNGGAGDDRLDGRAGDDTIDGGSGQNYLRGDEGNDVIVGGSGFDDSNGNMGNDTIHGNGGDDFSVGGKDNDLLFGDAGNDIVWGNLGNDTCDGGDGNDQVRGGQGDDSVSGGAGNDFVSGDRGNDTISGGSGADLFHGSQDAGIDRVLDFHLYEGDRVQLDPGTIYTVGQLGADTVIDMGGANQMILVGVQFSTLTPGWIFLG